MIEKLWDLFIYVLAFGAAFYLSYEDNDLILTTLITLTLIGFVSIVNTLLSLLGYALLWTWKELVKEKEINANEK